MRPFSKTQRVWTLALAMLLAVVGQSCGQRVDTTFGFSVRTDGNIQVVPLVSRTEGNVVELVHRAYPRCLYGKLEAFGPDTAVEYFRRLNEETDLARRKPFLQEDASPKSQGSLYLARVRAYDEDLKSYQPAVVGAFPVRGKLWIGWLFVRCRDEEMMAAAEQLLYSVDSTR